MEQAIAIFLHLGDATGEAYALEQLGWLHLRQGRFEEACTAAERGLRICRRLGDRALEARLLRLLGEVRLASGQPEVAVHHLRESWAVAEATNRPLYAAEALRGLGDAYAASGNLPQAERTWRRALGLYGQLGVPHAATLSERLSRLRS
jgi:tetratricopeptide (TPR) repeat protein